MAIRTIDRPVSLPCPCGGTMQPAQRFEATRTVDVVCCWTCGEERPPLYTGNIIRRVSCRWCGVRFTTRTTETVCSPDCERRATDHHEMRHQEGQRNRRRVG